MLLFPYFLNFLVVDKVYRLKHKSTFPEYTRHLLKKEMSLKDAYIHKKLVHFINGFSQLNMYALNILIFLLKPGARMMLGHQKIGSYKL